MNWIYLFIYFLKADRLQVLYGKTRASNPVLDLGVVLSNSQLEVSSD